MININRQPFYIGYLKSIAAVAAAVLLRIAFSGLFGHTAPYFTFYPAVMLAAILGGFWPGVLATVLSALIADYWLLSPYWQFGSKSPDDILTLVLFCFMGLFMSSVAGLYRSSRDKADSLERELSMQESREELETSNENLQAEIIERMQAESNQRLMAEVLRILNRGGGDLHFVIGEMLSLIKNDTYFDAVGLRLRKGEDCPYYEQSGFSDEFLLEENFLCEKRGDGSIILDAEGQPTLQCTCGLVLSGQTDPSMPCFTEGGSFWTNKSSDLLALTPEEDPRTNPRNRCIHVGYQSVALIPVRSGEEIIGLLQLNGRPEDMFTLDSVHFFESLADNIGLALKRKLAEDALRESEERLKRSQEISHLGSWELDLANNHLIWSDEVYRIFGLIPQEFEATYEAFLEAVHPEDHAVVDDAYSSSIRDGRDTYEIEHRVVRKNTGEIRWVHEKCEHIRNENNDIVRSTGMVMDVTERKQAEQERETTVEFLRLVNNCTGSREMIKAVLEFFKRQSGCDAVGIRLRQNDDYPYCEVSGFTNEFVEAENSLCIHDSEGRVERDSDGYPILECMCGNVICGRFDPSKPFFTEHGSFWTNNTTKLLASITEADRQARTRNRCNGEGFQSVALLPLRIGEERLGLLQMNDHRENMFTPELISLWERLTDQIAVALAKFFAEESLLESQEDLNRAQAVAHTGSWRLNVQRNELLWSDENHLIFGIPKGVPLKYETFLSTVHPDDREYVDREWQAGLRGEPYDIEHRLMVNGNVKWVRETAVLEFDDQGVLLGGFGTTQDINDRKLAEEQIHHHHTILEGINRIFREAMRSETEEDLGILCLTVAEEVTGSKFGFIAEINEEGRLDDVVINDPGWEACKMANPIGHRTVSAGFEVHGIYGRVITGGKGFYTNDPSSHPDSVGPPEGHPQLTAFLGVPLIYNNKVVGLIGLGNKEGGYTDEDLEAIEALANPIAQVFKRWQAEQEKEDLLRREHYISEMLQQTLIPSIVPYVIRGISIAARYQSALQEAQVGGDFYDIFELGDDKIGVLIGDVAGKGLQAAIRVSAVRYSVRSYAYLDHSPGRVMTLANEALRLGNPETESMLTAFFAVIDTADGTMTYANAGHEPPVIYSTPENLEELVVTGPMLGILQDAVYFEETCRLNSGDTVVMFTDGITEARHDSILFDKSGVIEHLKKASDARPEEIAEALLNAATVHAGGSLQDDAAIVVLGVPKDE